MKNLKQLKQAVLQSKKKAKVRHLTQRAFGKLRSNFGFIYLD
ncbi:MAG: hypothetical protein V7782_03070 [Psychromonas sp.]